MDVLEVLKRHGIQPTPQRLAVAEVVLSVREHVTAERAWERVRRRCPTVSRATVYNTLNLLVKKGLLRTQVLREGTVVFDPHVEAHHHFVDTKTGRIYDIPWDALKVTGQVGLKGFEVVEYQVILRGRRRVH
ncbi:MAG: transcriptional repressor [Phycisphaerae bacterium]|nr:transcriptional repressor [Phycisphaerae bacterium]